MVIASAARTASKAELELELGPYAAGELNVLSFEADEALSSPYEVVVTAAPAPGVEVDASSLVGEAACLHLALGGGEARYFDGIVAAVRAWEEGAGEARRRLRLTIRPKLWRLSKIVRSRIFQELSVPDIVKQVLREGGIEHRLALSATYARRAYCVQYRESNLAFVERLLEAEGILWFFEHEHGRHTLVLGDGPSVHQPLRGEHRLPFREASRMVADAEHVDGFTYERELRPGKVTLRDYDPLRPALELTGSVAGDAEADLEVYEYPGGFQESGEGKARARVRLEAERARAAVHGGTSPCRTLAPGAWFELDEHPMADLNGEYVVVSVRHRGEQAEALGGVGTAAARAKGEPYRNDFTCLRKDVPWRPEARTPRPVISGPQTAAVVGPQGEEIFTDEQGRIKVQFHWDREGQHDDRSSCWLRVAQAWAGAGWGALYLPRVGHEVVVEFLEGDPDRPLVTGSVYNGANPPPLSLPADKTRSTLRSASSPGSEGFNELRFEDAKGQEEVFLHAQRDLSIVVENDKAQRVGGHETLTVEKDRTRSVGGNQALLVEKDDGSRIGQDQTLVVARDRTTTVGGSHAETIGGDQVVSVGATSGITVALAASETVGLAKALTIGAAYAVSVGGAMNEAVGGLKAEEVGGAKVEVIGAKKSETVVGGRTLAVGGDLAETVDRSRTLKVGKDLVLEVGGSFTHAAQRGYKLKAKEITLSAGDEFTLRVGSATIQVTKAGAITIQGAQVKVTASGALTLKGAPLSEN